MFKFLVTGGAGFIGSHLVETLIGRFCNCQVAVLDKKEIPECLKRIDQRRVFYGQCDIADERDVRKYFEWFRPEYVFHLAAEARIQPSFNEPDLYVRTNALGTYNILVASREVGVRRVVYSASSSAYGEQAKMPLKEDMALLSTALHVYGSTKRMGEMLMSDLGKMTGGPETVSLRYFNVYGPRQPTEGEYATVIGIFLRQMMDNEPLTIVPDGCQRRDYTYVSDVARANITAALSRKVGNAEIINIGTGANYSVWDVARVVLGVSSKTTPKKLLDAGLCKMLPQRKGEVRETLADISKAEKLLKWSPFIGFKDGIEITRKEHKKYSV